MRSSVRLALFGLVLSTLACDKLGLKKPVPDAGIVDAAVAVADVSDAGADESDGAPAPMLDAGPTIATTHVGPVGLVGTFEGTANEGKIHYGMTAVLADRSGTISYSPPFDCKGTWTFVSHDAAKKTWQYKEHITVQTGHRKCADGETATIVETSATTFTYNEGSAHSTLSKH